MIEALDRSRFSLRQRVSRQQWQGDGRIEVADNGIGQSIGIDLSPSNSFGRSGAGQASGIHPGIGKLQVIIVTLFVQPKHFLNLRLRLKYKILRRAASND